MNSFIKQFNGYTAFVFQNRFPDDAVEQYKAMARAGDCFAPFYVEFLEAVKCKDFEKLAEFIPNNWFELYQKEFYAFLPEYEKSIIDGLAASTQIDNDTRETRSKSDLFEVLALKNDKSPSEVEGITEKAILFTAKIKLFLKLYGNVIPEDENGPKVPIPFIAKFFGVPVEVIADIASRGRLPSFFDFHAKLSRHAIPVN